MAAIDVASNPNKPTENKVYFLRIDDLPVVVCVIEAPGDNFGVGFSICPRDRFRERTAVALAQARAEESIERRFAFLGGAR